MGAVAVVAGTMLGVGILLTPPVVATATGSPLLFFALWALGGLVALGGAVAYAELGAMMPGAGGDVVFQRAAFGAALAFGSGVLTCALAFSGSIAAMSVAVSQYQVPALAAAAGWAFDPAAAVGPVTGAQLGGALAIVGITALNAGGARLAAGVQVALTAVPVAALVGLAVVGLLGPGAGAAAPRPVDLDVGALVGAWSSVYFAYAGWPAVVYVAGEVRDPGRTLPVGMVGGTLGITALYLLLCAAMVHVLGFDGLGAAGEAGSALTGAVLGEGARPVMTALVALALLASVNGTVLGGARVAQGMAAQGALPAAFGRLSSRAGAPATALWAQCAVAVAFALTGTFETILVVTGMAMMVVGSVTVLALFALRRQQPAIDRPYRTTGYPVLPALYVVVSLGMVGLWTVTGLADGSIWLPLAGVALLPALALAWWWRGR